MIAEVQKALTAYTRLDSTGKRLFRNELGLVRPQQATKRRRRKPAADAPTGDVPVVRRSRGRRVEVSVSGAATPGAQPAASE